MFETFEKAYNENIEKNSRKEEKPYLGLNTFRSIFIEGLPGSGKSTATFVTLLKMLDKNHPSLL